MNYEAKQELEIIREQNNGFLRPQDVVEFAKDDSTALHKYFEWDDTEAAKAYRLAQARAVIRVCVQVSESTSEQVRAYVSLSTDRNSAGGYRALAEVISDEVLAETLMNDALKELAAFQRKYNRLKQAAELGDVFSAIERVVRTNVRLEDRPAA